MTDHPFPLTRRQFALRLTALPAIGLMAGCVQAHAGHQDGPLILDARLAERRRSYSVGEVVSLFLRVNQDAQVAILNIDALNRVTVLRPNRFAPSTRMPANRWLQFPAPGSDYVLQVAAPPGRNEIRILASAGQRPILPAELLRRGEGGFDQIEGGRAALEGFMDAQGAGNRARLAERRLRFRVIA
ncbi:MAG: DUF4384 domain-containing protein [Pararhodobacter sp.]|nr:DUF4384 domain-containing protein [Pararhodobacter sp.]